MSASCSSGSYTYTPSSALGGTGTKGAPEAVIGGLTFAQITAGRKATCALTAAGVAYCWGYSTEGQLGNNDTSADRTSPVAVSGGRTFTTIVSGNHHTMGF